jgi:hypothetical protein
MNWLRQLFNSQSDETAKPGMDSGLDAVKTAAQIVLMMSKDSVPMFLKAFVGRDQERPELASALYSELLVLALHLADRFAYVQLGPERRDCFMNALLPTVQRELYSQLRSDLQGLYNNKNAQYSKMRLVQAEMSESLKGTLLWEFNKTLCLAYAPYPEVLMRITPVTHSFILSIHDAFEKAHLFPRFSN